MHVGLTVKSEPCYGGQTDLAQQTISGGLTLSPLHARGGHGRAGGIIQCNTKWIVSLTAGVTLGSSGQGLKFDVGILYIICDCLRSIVETTSLTWAS